MPYPAVNSQFAIEHGPFIVDIPLPSENGDVPWQTVGLPESNLKTKENPPQQKPT